MNYLYDDVDPDDLDLNLRDDEQIMADLKAKQEWDAAYALWIDGGQMCECRQPITLEDYFYSPHLCLACQTALNQSNNVLDF